MTIEIPIYLDSSASAGTVSGDGRNVLTVNLTPPIVIEHLRKASFVACECSFWNESPNISTKLGNNIMSFTYGTPFSLTIPDGLYGISDLQQIMGDFFLNNGLGEDTIVIEGIYSTGKSTVQLKSAGISIDPTVPGSVFGPNLLGFTAPFSSTIAEQTFTSQLKSTFNKVDAVLFHLSFINGSVYNSNWSDVAMRCQIDVPAGYQVTKVLQLAKKAQISQRLIDTIVLRVTNQSNQDLTLNDPFSLTGYILIED